MQPRSPPNYMEIIMSTRSGNTAIGLLNGLFLVSAWATICVAHAAGPQPTSIASGTITFHGSIVEGTCSVNTVNQQLSDCSTRVARQVKLSTSALPPVNYSETLRTEKDVRSDRLITRKIILANYD